MELVGVFVCPLAEILFVHESGEMKMSFITHKQIVNFILVHTSQEFTTNFLRLIKSHYLNIVGVEV
jgi:hypothetical protein